MSDVDARNAEASATLNPANRRGRFADGSKRIPMSLPRPKLQVPAIPGFYSYWMKGTPDRILQAQQAGFEFVHPDEVELSQVPLGGDASQKGNTDLGTRVSVLASTTGDGEIGSDGQPLRLYLMKQPMEYYLEDQKLLQNRNDQVAQALTSSFRTGRPVDGRPTEGESSEDLDRRYTKTTKVPDLFRKKQ